MCSTVYVTYPCKLKKGWQLYCSKLCSSLARGKRIIRLCQICKKEFIVYSSKLKHNAVIFCSNDCAGKGALGKPKLSIRGENHPNWKGGIQNLPYPFEFNDEFKESIRKRDGHDCQLCELSNEEHILVYGYDLVIHHIDYVKENCDKTNLTSLCIQCNGRVNYNRAYWTEFFTRKLVRGYAIDIAPFLKTEVER